MHAWIGHAERLLKSGELVVLVTVARAEGSTPREPGARMLVTYDKQWLTIGGGNLEWQAADMARTMLKAAPAGAARKLERISLGPALGQCCGGVATLAFERLDAEDLAWLSLIDRRLRDGQASRRSVVLAAGMQKEAAGGVVLAEGMPPDVARRVEIDEMPGPALDGAQPLCRLHENKGCIWMVDVISPPDFPIFLFGAGHVGQALIRILGTLSCPVVWIDERDAQFPADVPSNVAIEATDTPEAVIAQAPPGSYFLVMTHSHPLDQRLCQYILKRDDYAYFGLIGSRTKRRKFERRLQERGVTAQQLERMVCPIGVPGIRGKAPEIIAVAVAAQLLQYYERRSASARGMQPDRIAADGIMASRPAHASVPDALFE
jgi:xanthine dehydrogenase accessory factor